MTEQQKNIQKSLKKVMSKERYQHTIGVAYTAACLAMNYGYDMERAMTAGLLHDCAKSLSDKEQISLCRENNIKIRDVELENPFLLHAKTGAHLAKETYGIKDPEILHAITVHTTGAPQMGLLDKILFAADYIEPNREKAPNLTTLRNLCFTDLNCGVLQILEDTMHYLSKKNCTLDTLTKETYEYYKRSLEE